ncbi:DEAD/DEAH box helicase family protein [Candidatus Uhrbacteria bacterium]|nr:DEAD/DEAH box helicase family protein [Candidatus Uhrbacteria bacterium]
MARRVRDSRTLDLFAPRPTHTAIPPPSSLCIAERVEDRPSHRPAVAAAIATPRVGIVAATGTGKTYIAIRVADRTIGMGGSVLVTAPTKPLCVQHAADFRQCFRVPPDEVVTVTGRIRSAKRRDVWTHARIAIATPETVANDLARGILDPHRFALLVIDEAHLAVERYAAIAVARAFAATPAAILALTAGDDTDALERVRQNLHLDHWVHIPEEATRIERPPITDRIVRIPLPPELQEIARGFHAVLERIRDALAAIVPLESSSGIIRTRELKRVGGIIRAHVADGGGAAWYQAMTLTAAYWKLLTIATYAITEDFTVALEELDALMEHPSRAARRLRVTPEVVAARTQLQAFVASTTTHPKQVAVAAAVVDAIERHTGGPPRILVYDRFTRPAARLAAYLATACGVRTEVVYGQREMKTERAVELLAGFRYGEFPVLVATQVVRQGIHVPDVHELFTYSPPLNGTEYIQIRGRTGRTDVGAATMFIMDDPLDRRLAFSARARGRAIMRTVAGAAGMGPQSGAPPPVPTAHAARTSHFTSRKQKVPPNWVRDLARGLLFERFQVRESEAVLDHHRPYVRMRVGDRTGDVTLLHWCPYGGKQAQEIAAHFPSGTMIIVSGTYHEDTHRITVDPQKRHAIDRCPPGDYLEADYTRLPPPF